MTARERLAAAPPEVRAHVLALLDEISAPMHPREIEAALIATGGFSRSERRKNVRALKALPIIAVGVGRTMDHSL